MASKFTGRYTNAATKALKLGSRLICQVEGDDIFLTNGAYTFRMDKYEYDAVARKATQCDPGNWIHDNLGARELVPGQYDGILKIFRDNAEALKDKATTIKRAPMYFKVKGTDAAAYFHEASGRVTLFNPLYVDAIGTTYSLHGGASSTSPAMFFDGNGDPIALVLPVRRSESVARAVRTFFTESENEQGADKTEDLEDEIARLKADLQIVRDELAQTQRELEAEELKRARAETERDELRTAKPEAETPPAPSLAEAADLIAKQFSELPGVEIKIKGKTTHAPVVWIEGDTEQHAEMLEAAGAKWSRKKGAYYVQIQNPV